MFSVIPNSPTLDDFDRFFRDSVVLEHLRPAMHDGSLVTFELEHDGARRAWTVHHDDGRLWVTEPDGRGTDCTLRCAGSDFRDLVVGTLDPRVGFMDGRLVVQGDVAIVLSLRRTLRGLVEGG